MRIPESLGGVWSPSPHRSGSTPRRPDLPSRGVLHTTESPAGSWAGVRSSLEYPYHGLVEVKQRKTYQLVDLDLTAYSLKGSTQFETNHAGRHCVQFSLVMYAQDTPSLTRGDLQYLADLCGWVNEQTGIANKWAKTMGPGEGVVLATESSPIRLSPLEWYQWDGWIGHQHAPGNDHWDCGALDVKTIQELIAAKETPPMLTPEFVQTGHRSYPKDAAAFEFVRASLAELGFAPGGRGQNIDRAIVAFKQRFMGADAATAEVGGAFWRRLIGEVAGIRTAEPAIVHVADPAMAAKVAALEDKIARIRALTN